MSKFHDLCRQSLTHSLALPINNFVQVEVARGCLSPSGYLILCSTEGSILIYSPLPDEFAFSFALYGHSSPIISLAAGSTAQSKDCFLTFSEDRRLISWSISQRSGMCLKSSVQPVEHRRFIFVENSLTDSLLGREDTLILCHGRYSFIIGLSHASLSVLFILPVEDSVSSVTNCAHFGDPSLLTIATATADTLWVWTVRDLTRKPTEFYSPMENPESTIINFFKQKSQIYLILSSNGQSRVADYSHGKLVFQFPTRTDDGTLVGTRSTQEQFLALLYDDGVVLLFSLDVETKSYEFLKCSKNDGKMVFCDQYFCFIQNSMICFVDPGSLTTVRRTQVTTPLKPAISLSVTCLIHDAASDYIICGTDEGGIHCFRGFSTFFEAGEACGEISFPNAHVGRVTALLSLANHKRNVDPGILHSGGEDMSVVLLSLSDRTLLRRFHVNGGAILRLCCPGTTDLSSMFYDSVCSIGADHSLALIGKNKCLLTVCHPANVQSVFYDASIDYLHVLCGNGQLYVWNAQEGYLDSVVVDWKLVQAIVAPLATLSFDHVGYFCPASFSHGKFNLTTCSDAGYSEFATEFRLPSSPVRIRALYNAEGVIDWVVVTFDVDSLICLLHKNSDNKTGLFRGPGRVPLKSRAHVLLELLGGGELDCLCLSAGSDTLQILASSTFGHLEPSLQCLLIIIRISLTVLLYSLRDVGRLVAELAAEVSFAPSGTECLGLLVYLTQHFSLVVRIVADFLLQSAVRLDSDRAVKYVSRRYLEDSSAENVLVFGFVVVHCHKDFTSILQFDEAFQEVVIRFSRHLWAVVESGDNSFLVQSALTLVGRCFPVIQPHVPVPSLIIKMLQLADCQYAHELKSVAELRPSQRLKMCSMSALTEMLNSRPFVFVTILSREIKKNDVIMEKHVPVIRLLLNVTPLGPIWTRNDIITDFIQIVSFIVGACRNRLFYDLFPNFRSCPQIAWNERFKIVAFGMSNGKIIFFQAKRTKMYSVRFHKKCIDIIKFSPDCCMFASLSKEERNLGLWRLENFYAVLSSPILRLIKDCKLSDADVAGFEWNTNSTVCVSFVNELTACFEIINK